MVSTSTSPSRIPTFRRLFRSLRVLRLPLLVCTSVFVVALLIYNLVAIHRWEAYRREATARGVMIDRSAPAARIPDRENLVGTGSPFAPWKTGMQSWLGKWDGMHLDAPNIALGERMTTAKAYSKQNVVWEVRRVANGSKMERVSTPVGTKPLVPGQPQTAEDFLACCERNFSNEWPAILEAEARPRTQYSDIDADGANQQFCALNARKTAQVHGMRGLAFLDLGRDAEALKEVQECFTLARALGADDNHQLIPAMIRVAIITLNLADVWEGLVDRRWSDADLVALRKELDSFSPSLDWAQTAKAERQQENSAYDKLAALPPTQRGLVFVRQRKPDPIIPTMEDRLEMAAWSLALASPGFIRENQVVVNKYWDAAERRVSPNGHWHPEIKPDAAYDLDKLSSKQKIHYALAATTTPSIERAACRVVVVETYLTYAKLAIAIEQYRRQHQELPENLAALAPDFIAEIPSDPFYGEAIRYVRPTADSYELRVSGESRHSGDPRPYEVWFSPKKGESTDLVWHGLAPETEVIKTAAR